MSSWLDKLFPPPKTDWLKPRQSVYTSIKYNVDVPPPRSIAHDSILPKSTMDIPPPKLPNLLPKTFAFEKWGNSYYLYSYDGGNEYLRLAKFESYDTMQITKEILGKSVECGQTRREMGI